MATKDRKALKLARHEGVVGSFLTDPSHHFPDKDHFVVLVLLISAEKLVENSPAAV